MYSISAADSISLAMQRTKQFLFHPFRWGTYLKLGLVAMITEGIGNNLNSSKHNGGSVGQAPTFNAPFDISPVHIAVIAAAAMLALLLCIWIFYLITRLRFAFFHCLIHNTTEIGPGWRLYQSQALRFFWLSVGVGVSYMLLFCLAALPFVGGFVRLFHQTPAGATPDLWQLLALILPMIPVILFFVLTAFALEVILRDGMLPHYALEDATAGEAWQEVWEHIKAEKSQFAVYALLRFMLPIAATIGLIIVFLLPGAMLAGAGVAIGYAIHSTFANATGAAALVGILLQAFYGVIAFAFALLAGICLGGPVSTGLREYALIFYGGRYQELGEILYPPPPIAPLVS
ncbi:MAG: hypothetical protein WCF54_09755 [Terracidiphilus sp.]